jgi:hypothetical protein
MANRRISNVHLREQIDAISADLLRVPIDALEGRPTPSRVREVQRLTDAGLLSETVGRHLVAHGRIDDVSWELTRPLRDWSASLRARTLRRMRERSAAA